MPHRCEIHRDRLTVEKIDVTNFVTQMDEWEEGMCELPQISVAGVRWAFRVRMPNGEPFSYFGKEDNLSVKEIDSERASLWMKEKASFGYERVIKVSKRTLFSSTRLFTRIITQIRTLYNINFSP